MWLDVSICAMKELFGFFYGQILAFIDIHASTVIAFVWITFRVFGGENRTLGFHNVLGGVIFRSDQFDAFVLPFRFVFNQRFDFFIQHR